MAKNYYEILGVAKSATPEEIKKAYKKQAIKWHPDRHSSESEEKQKEAAEKFKDVGEAYDVLKDPQKKAHYDSYGTMDNFGGGYSGPDPNDMASFFQSMFGGGDFFQQRTGPEPGESLRIQVTLSLKELMSSKTVDVNYNTKIRCPNCQGAGGTGIDSCKHCQGTGHSVEVQRTPFGISQQITICPHCHGTGKTVKNVCKTCNGEGLISKHKHLTITIPSNIQHGSRIRYSGAGNEAKEQNAPNGDLWVYFFYSYDHNKFEIDERNNIYEKVKIPYYDCILGTSYKHILPTRETVEVIIPKYTQIGNKIEIPNKGIQGSSYYLVIECELPTHINKEEESLLQQIKHG